MRTIMYFLWRHKLKLIISLVILVPAAGIAYFFLKPVQKEYVTAIATQGDLVQTVEVVGTVISEKDLELKFPATGIVESVYITEGDKVASGMVLAELRNSREEADVAAARANYLAALADLRELKEGTRPEEITIAEAEVANKRASLQAAQSSLASAEANLVKSQAKLKELESEVEISLEGTMATTVSTISQQLTAVQNSLNEVDDDFESSVLENAIEFFSNIEYGIYKRHRQTAMEALAWELKRPSSTTYAKTLSRVSDARSSVQTAVTVVDSAYDLVVSLPLTNYITDSVKEGFKDSIASERNSIQTALNKLDTAAKTLRDAAAVIDTRIATEQAALQTSQGTRDRALADIQTFQTALTVAEAQLQLKKNGARQSDIDAAAARASQAFAQLQLAEARLVDTIIKAPIDGRITKVNLKVGEFTGDFQNDEKAITMLGNSPFRIELFAPEIDIPKVDYGQTATVELDAYPSQEFALRVAEIDPASTTVDGVPKYRIKLDFTDPAAANWKIGMTGDVDIITGQVAEVIKVPGRAVIKNDQNQDIIRLLINGNEVIERPVTVGMQAATDVEVQSGVEAGEEVIILITEK